MLRRTASLLVCGVLLAPAMRAQDEAEYRIKLAFLYNFAQFIEWPAEAFRDPAAPFTICVAGRNPFQGDTEQELRGRTAAGRPIQIKALKADGELSACQIAFVRAGEKNTTAWILAGRKGSSTLVVGEAKGFAQQGGTANLIVEEKKLRFEVNLEAARQTRLKFSAKLLSLARIVTTD